MKKLIIILIILLVPRFMNAQAECVIDFSYKGKIDRVNISDSSEVTLLVPSSYMIAGVGDKTDESNFHTILISKSQDKFEEMFATHSSSDFCRFIEDIINHIFIGKNKHYKLIIKTGAIRKEIYMKIGDIKFTINQTSHPSAEEKDSIEIELADIKI